ncbi:MerR family DNA-binding transcriptional regulator [Rhodococcus pyridinivorans]
MADTTRLMSIGEFSTLTRISVRMLRHYDSQGVLIPAVVDEVSGYRRYLPEQTADAARDSAADLRLPPRHRRRLLGPR